MGFEVRYPPKCETINHFRHELTGNITGDKFNNKIWVILLIPSWHSNSLSISVCNLFTVRIPTYQRTKRTA